MGPRECNQLHALQLGMVALGHRLLVPRAGILFADFPLPRRPRPRVDYCDLLVCWLDRPRRLHWFWLPQSVVSHSSGCDRVWLLPLGTVYLLRGHRYDLLSQKPQRRFYEVDPPFRSAAAIHPDITMTIISAKWGGGKSSKGCWCVKLSGYPHVGG
jgi:hypothetical protein